MKKHLICENIRRMREAGVEPYTVIMDETTHRECGKPRKLLGVPVECDRTLSIGWLVR